LENPQHTQLVQGLLAVAQDCSFQQRLKQWDFVDQKSRWQASKAVWTHGQPILCWSMPNRDKINRKLEKV